MDSDMIRKTFEESCHLLTHPHITDKNIIGKLIKFYRTKKFRVEDNNPVAAYKRDKDFGGIDEKIEKLQEKLKGREVKIN